MNELELSQGLGRGESRSFAVLGDTVRVFRDPDNGLMLTIDTVRESEVVNRGLESWVNELADGVNLRGAWGGQWSVRSNKALASVLAQMRARGAWCRRSAWSTSDQEVARRLYAAFAAHPDRRVFRLAWSDGSYFDLTADRDRGRLSAWVYRAPGLGEPSQPIPAFERLVAEQGDEVRRDTIAPDRETPIDFPVDHPLLERLGPFLLEAIAAPLRSIDVELQRG